MTTIRYATDGEKIACAQTLTSLDHHTVRFYHHGQWQSGSTKADVRLVEVWRRHGHHVPFVHPSRNPFFWVSGPDAEDQKELWDSLTAPEIMQTMRSGYEAQRSRDVIKRKGIKHPKSAATPLWASPDTLIGYTCKRAITLPDDISLIDFDRSFPDIEELPSVYYQRGHATLCHPKQGNIGWEDFSPLTELYSLETSIPAITS